VRLSTSAVGELLAEIDSSVERQATVLIEIDVQGLEVSWSVDDTNFSGLHEIVGNNNMLLVGSNLDIVRADSWLILIRVIKTFDIVQVTDIQSSNVVGSGQSQVDEAAVLGDVGAFGRLLVSIRFHEMSNSM